MPLAQVANVYGHSADKQDLAGRQRFTASHLADVLDSAHNPIHGRRRASIFLGPQLFMRFNVGIRVRFRVTFGTNTYILGFRASPGQGTPLDMPTSSHVRILFTVRLVNYRGSCPRPYDRYRPSHVPVKWLCTNSCKICHTNDLNTGAKARASTHISQRHKSVHHKPTYTCQS